jgi:hypothetical protein
VLAALAGARVQALARTTRFGTSAEGRSSTEALAELAGVRDRVEVVVDRGDLRFEEADVVTNSSHLRPIDAGVVSRLRAGAVIPLMFEAWEFRAADLDLEACRRRGIPVAGTNEQHQAIDVFSFLGPMAVKLLFDAGFAVRHGRFVVLCDNPFAPYLVASLERLGASVQLAGAPSPRAERPDAVLVAMRPRLQRQEVVDLSERIARCYAGAAVVQYWGDLDRPTLAANGMPCWPRDAPAPGHMAVLPSDVGPEAVVRLQAGGLKVAEVLLRPEASRTRGDLEFIQPL